MTGIGVAIGAFLCLCMGIVYGVLAAATGGAYGVLFPFAGMGVSFLIAACLIWSESASGALLGAGTALVQLVWACVATGEVAWSGVTLFLLGLVALLLWIWWRLRRRSLQRGAL
jgi:hypothetical protein